MPVLLPVVEHSRRRFLARASLALGAGAAMPLLPGLIRSALAVPPARITGTVQDVQHVVILMQENRSFDHYFGCLRGVRGYGDPRPLRLPSGKPVWYQPERKGCDRYVLPFRLNSQTSSAQWMKDLNHDWKGSHETWKHHDAWIAQKSAMSMGHFQREDLPFYYALADAFTICDGYHASLFGPTNPNRMYMFTGTSGLSVGNDGEQAVNNRDDGNWTADMARDNPRFPGYTWRHLLRAPAGGRRQLAGLSGVRQLRRQQPSVLRQLSQAGPPPRRCTAAAAPSCPAPPPTTPRPRAANIWRRRSRATCAPARCRRCRGSWHRTCSASIPRRRRPMANP